MQASTAVRVVLMTAPDREVAVQIVRRLVEEQLVACGNVLPGMVSIYRWEGEVQEDPEALVILKTHEDSLSRLMRRVPELHPYDVPELLALPVTEGLSSYIDWVALECDAASAG